MKELSSSEINEVAGGSLYSEINDAYMAAKEFCTEFWASAKAAYGLES